MAKGESSSTWSPKAHHFQGLRGSPALRQETCSLHPQPLAAFSVWAPILFGGSKRRTSEQTGGHVVDPCLRNTKCFQLVGRILPILARTQIGEYGGKKKHRWFERCYTCVKMRECVCAYVCECMWMCAYERMWVGNTKIKHKHAITFITNKQIHTTLQSDVHACSYTKEQKKNRLLSPARFPRTSRRIGMKDVGPTFNPWKKIKRLWRGNGYV